MKHRYFHRLGAVLLTLALSLSLAAPAWAAATTGDPALKVSITESGSFGTGTTPELQVDGSGTLTAAADIVNLPAGASASPYSYTWSMDPADNSRAEFAAGSGSSSSVSITAKAEGSVTVKVEVKATVTLADSTTQDLTGSAEFKFDVVPVGVTGVTISTYSMKNNPSTPLILDKTGQQEQLHASVTPPNATDPPVTWESDDPTVAAVDPDSGVVTAVGVGRTVITAKAGTGEKAPQDSCRVEVSGGILYRSETEDNVVLTELSLLLGGKSYTPRFEAYGNASETQGTTVQRYWQSDDPLVAAVNRTSGVITPRGVGETCVRFTYVVNGRPYDVSPIEVTVSEDDRSIFKDNATAGAPYLLSEIMSELNSICREQTGYPLSYITNVMVPTREGVLYYNHVSSDDTGFGVGATERYYYDEETVGERYLSGLTFVPNSDFNGTTTITFTGYATNKKVYSGKIRLTVTGSGNVTFITKANEALTFNSAGFSAACRSETGREVEKVSFVLPDASKGLFCYGYSGGGYRYEVTEGEDYYRSRAPYIDQVSFIPAEYYIGTLTLPFYGEDTAGITFRGKLHIIVVPNRPDGERSELTTTALRGTAVDFGKFDFNAACQAALGQPLSYVRFTPPPSSAGTLYYKYTSSGRYDSLVNANTRYYPSRTPYLKDLTFVPSYDRIAPVTIDFVGYSSSGKSFDGTVTIYYRDSGSVGDVITYAVTSGQAIPFEPADFNDLCQNVTGKDLSRIVFDYLPDTYEGTLYYNYDSGSSTGTKVTTKTSLYLSGSPRLSSAAFAPRSDFVGTVELEFNGYTTDGTRFPGVVRINVEEGNTTLRYSVYSGASVDFDGDAFNTICKQATDGKLNYVRFVLPKSTEGKLYYRYNNSTGKSTVSASSSYYYSTSGSNKLDNVFFTAAANYTGRVSIDYTGFSTSGARFTGTVEIDVAYHRSTTLDYTSTSVPFQIPASEIFSACSPLLDKEISYVLLNSLPKTDEGKLYYDYVGYNTGSEVKTSTKFYRDKTSYLNRVVFVPKEGFTGTVSLPYSAFDTRGDSVSGTVNIEIVAPAASVFTDMGGHIWAISSVDFLYDSGVVEGTGSSRYEPEGDFKRGDFVLMLYRVFNLRAAGSKSFSDVPEDSYYAEAIASAKAQNVITGENGLFRPEDPITRQDSMVFLRNAMRAAGISVPSGSPSELYAFADYNSVSDQARSAVLSMIHMGIVKGDDHRRLNPTSSISRAEMAVLMHRAMTL